MNIATAVEHLERVVALKLDDGWWATYDDRDGEYLNRFVTLITPLIPARPQDTDRELSYWEQQIQIGKHEREATPETVTTEEEYGALPEGSVVAEPGKQPWTHTFHVWAQGSDTTNDYGLSGTTRQVLRRGRGE